MARRIIDVRPDEIVLLRIRGELARVVMGWRLEDVGGIRVYVRGDGTRLAEMDWMPCVDWVCATMLLERSKEVGAYPILRSTEVDWEIDAPDGHTYLTPTGPMAITLGVAMETGIWVP